jgi:RNA polymerase sigma factor (sigma-70 family)
MQGGESGSEREAAIERLFRTHYRLLRNYGTKMVDNPPLVEDAIQDVFLALWEGTTRVADLTAPKSYLLTALRRRVLERQSAQKSRRQRNQRHAKHFPSFSISQEALLISEELRAEQQDQLEMVLKRLPDRRKEALYLRFRHGLTYDEIASVMAIQPQTARNYVFKALQFLRQQPFLKPFLRPTGTWL